MFDAGLQSSYKSYLGSRYGNVSGMLECACRAGPPMWCSGGRRLAADVLDARYHSRVQGGDGQPSARRRCVAAWLADPAQFRRGPPLDWPEAAAMVGNLDRRGASSPPLSSRDKHEQAALPRPRHRNLTGFAGEPVRATRLPTTTTTRIRTTTRTSTATITRIRTTTRLRSTESRRRHGPHRVRIPNWAAPVVLRPRTLVQVWEHTIDGYVSGGEDALVGMRRFAETGPVCLHSLDLSIGSPIATERPLHLQEVRAPSRRLVSTIGDHPLSVSHRRDAHPRLRLPVAGRGATRARYPQRRPRPAR